MQRMRIVGVTLFVLALSGCYHQIVRTGEAPGPTVVERPWTATWVFGLVAADVINTTQACPGGVAIIETRQSFMNGLVGVLTIGIYTPQSVRITCAGSQDDDLPEAPRVSSADPDDVESTRAATDRALRLASETGGPVILTLAP